MINNSNILKTLQTQTFLDKENNARNANITAIGDRKNFYARKTKKLQEITNKPSSVLLDNTESVRSAALSNIASKPIPSIIARAQEESELNRKINANRIKKTLNFEESQDAGIMCDESNYSSVNSNASFPNKPQDDKMSLEKDIMQVEKERKKSFIETNNKMIEESITPKLSSNEKDNSFGKSYQNKIIEKYAPCILKTFKEKDVRISSIIQKSNLITYRDPQLPLMPLSITRSHQTSEQRWLTGWSKYSLATNVPSKLSSSLLTLWIYSSNGLQCKLNF